MWTGRSTLVSFTVTRLRVSLSSSRHVLDNDRILLVLTDGSQAFEIKDFLVQQERCKEVTIDNRPYYGKGDKVSVFNCFVCTIWEFDVSLTLPLGRQEESQGEGQGRSQGERTVNSTAQSFSSLSLKIVNVQLNSRFIPSHVINCFYSSQSKLSVNCDCTLKLFPVIHAFVYDSI